MRRIVYTRPDRGVSVCCPAPEIITALQRGQYFGAMARGTVDDLIDQQISVLGHGPDVSARFVRGLAFGGLAEYEALEIIRDRDAAPHGTGCELWDADDVPTDRWFRDAWRRSPNGGPIGIDIGAARKIQLTKIRQAYTEQKEAATWSLDGDEMGELNLSDLRANLKRCVEPEHIRRVWPEGVQQCL